MSTSGSLLAFGTFGRDERAELGEVAAEASLDLQLVDSPARAADWLADNRPRVLLLDAATADAEAVCLNARANAEQALTPIISMAHSLDDLAFADVFSWGGDDAVEFRAARQLISRVRSLPADLDLTPTPRDMRGEAIVGDTDRYRRLVRARVLRNAGFTIRFAVTAEDVLELAGSATLVVMDAELPGAADALGQSAARNPNTLHILLAPPRDLAMLGRAIVDLPNAAVADGFSPPENVIFLANELERHGALDQRSSRRLLYGTKVAFRGAGRDADDFGFSYNVSEGGLYVRTLAPPREDRVWLELTPPRSDRRVRLEGEVVWRRGYGPSANATVPPGFGVKIIDSTQDSRAAWDNGYRQFLDVLRLG